MRHTVLACALSAFLLVSPNLSAGEITEIDVLIRGTTAPLETVELTQELTFGSTVISKTSVIAVDVSATPGQDDTVYVSRDGGTVKAFYYVDLVGEPTAGLFGIVSDVTSSPEGPGFSEVAFDILFEADLPDGRCTFEGMPADCPTSFIIGDPTITPATGCPLVVFCPSTPPDVGTAGTSIESWGISSSSPLFDIGIAGGIGFLGNDGTPGQPTAVSRFEIAVPPLHDGETSAQYEIAPQPTSSIVWVEDPQFGSPIIPGQIQAAPTDAVDTLTIHVIEGFVSSGDCDGDNDVDLTDFADLTLCFTGAGGQFTSPACACVDYDADRDIDLADFAEFQLRFTGAE